MIWTHNIWPFALDLTVKSTVVMLTALVIAYLLRARSAAAKDVVWTSVVALLFVLPLVQFLPSPVRVAPLLAAPSFFGTSVGSAAQARTQGIAYAIDVWALGAGLLFLRLIAGILGARWLASRAVTSNGLSPLCGWRGSSEVFMCDGTNVPLTTGLIRGRILLPWEARGWPAERILLTLTHEEAHIHRHDCLFNILTEMVRSLYWFNPLIWIIARSRRLEAEKACDDQVIAIHRNVNAYAHHLLCVARAASPRLNFGAASAAMTGGSGLEQRLVAILDEKRDRRGFPRVGFCTVLATCSVALLTCLMPAIAQNSYDRTYQIGENGVTTPKLLYKIEPRYTQDARDAHIEGTVAIGLEIDNAGLPQNVYVKRDLDPGLDQRAVEAIRQWRFAPGRKDGKPVRVAATVEVNFRLE